MRKGFLTSVAALLASGGLTLASPPGPIVQISFEDSDNTVVQAGSVSSGNAAPIQVNNVAPADMHGPGPISDSQGGPSGDVWFNAEYLMWWTKDSHLPAIVTTGPTTGGGLLGAKGTGTLLGGGNVDYGIDSGARFGGGMWLDDGHCVGFEADYLFLSTARTDDIISADGSAKSKLLARPFYDLAIKGQNSDIFADPGLNSGYTSVHTDSFLQGLDDNILVNVCCGCDGRVDALGGFRWLQLREDVGIHEHSVIICNCVNPFPANHGNSIDSYDLYGTHNNFYGGNMGLQAEMCRDNWFLRVEGQVALGDTHEAADLQGLTVITTPAGVQTIRPAGLLNVNGNIGHYSRDVFAVIPELGVAVGYQLTDHVRLFVGYSFLYWSNVLRAGDQVVLVSNSNRAGSSTTYNPTAAGAPGYTFHSTDYWAQGVNFGIEVRY